MKVNELEQKSKVVNLNGVISQLGEPQKTEGGKAFREGIVEDETGQVKITLWDKEVETFKQGDKILIETGWCKSYEGELQVSSGIHGKIKKNQDEKTE